MGKKRKRKKAKHTTQSAQKAPKQKKRSKYPLIGLAVGVALLIAGGYFLYQEKKPKQPAPERTKLEKENIRLRETRQTLSPQRFQGRAKKAYEIARAIPEVLDRLYCYCRCRENFRHRNLLSCFVDNHAVT
jgi:uncharacterized protein HemX